MEIRRVKPYLLTVAGLIIIAGFLFPVYWMVVTSIKPVTEMFQNPPLLFPAHPTVAAYSAVGDRKIITNIVNSFIIAGGTALCAILLATPLAYSLARLRIRGKALLLLFLLDLQMLPQIALALPFFVIFSQIHLTNTLFGLILADTVHAIPFTVLTIRPFFLTIPKELEDAAYIDGCNKFTAFWKIILPLIMPGFFTVGSFSFLMGWGDFTNALTLTNKAAIQPLTLGIYTFISQYGIQWDKLLAVSTVASLPILVIFVSLQKYIVSGIGAGAVKD